MPAMKIVTIVGNRPQLIRSAVLSPALRGAGLTEVVVSVGEADAAEEPELQPRGAVRRLRVNAADTNWMTLALTGILFDEDPDAVLVSGDARCTLAGARSAIEAGVPLAHVEAGVRSGELGKPEERMRLEVDRIASWLFCVDEVFVSALKDEGVRGEIFDVGDVLLDAARGFSKVAHRRYPIIDSGPYVITSVRREENLTAPRIGRILDGLNRLRYKVLFPAHLNTRSRLLTVGKIGQHVRLIEHLTYLESCSLVSGAYVVVTDSGSLQREAYWHGVPCVTLRPTTEWAETVAVGANVLVDDDPDALVDAVKHARMPKGRPSLYGDGHAADRIARALSRRLRG
jgi:UDP-GlcNAc3NAcA epimerase